MYWLCGNFLTAPCIWIVKVTSTLKGPNVCFQLMSNLKKLIIIYDTSGSSCNLIGFCSCVTICTETNENSQKLSSTDVDKLIFYDKFI